MSDTTTSYGTWCNRVEQYSTSPDADVADYIGGADTAWRERVERSGALDAMTADYRTAINSALPDSVSLCGDEFIGPAYPDDDEWDGYPTDEDGGLDIAACVEDISLDPIVEANDPLSLEEIGRDELKSAAKNPAKVASAAMSRLGLKPHAYVPHPDSGRPQAIYLAGQVRAALAKRPGQGKRTDLTDTDQT
ncbi:hypothetical protein [Streptomyces sp. SID8352]|uniref:hypothetical protein n=1 Tax=Streptomyces sp. SID8352 TaxID=2690338 RepID=UPI00136B69ED|nr:hypothetical protein [Streptomyces sp. SID8352]MYU24661.1 hypothetical protein [Streptomyces sp. SID8352]